MIPGSKASAFFAEADAAAAGSQECSRHLRMPMQDSPSLGKCNNNDHEPLPVYNCIPGDRITTFPIPLKVIKAEDLRLRSCNTGDRMGRFPVPPVQAGESCGRGHVWK